MYLGLERSGRTGGRHWLKPERRSREIGLCNCIKPRNALTKTSDESFKVLICGPAGIAYTSGKADFPGTASPVFLVEKRGVDWAYHEVENPLLWRAAISGPLGLDIRPAGRVRFWAVHLSKHGRSEGRWYHGNELYWKTHFTYRLSAIKLRGLQWIRGGVRHIFPFFTLSPFFLS